MHCCLNHTINTLCLLLRLQADTVPATGAPTSTTETASTPASRRAASAAAGANGGSFSGDNFTIMENDDDVLEGDDDAVADDDDHDDDDDALGDGAVACGSDDAELPSPIKAAAAISLLPSSLDLGLGGGGGAEGSGSSAKSLPSPRRASAGLGSSSGGDVDGGVVVDDSSSSSDAHWERLQLLCRGGWFYKKMGAEKRFKLQARFVWIGLLKDPRRLTTDAARAEALALFWDKSEPAAMPPPPPPPPHPSRSSSSRNSSSSSSSSTSLPVVTAPAGCWLPMFGGRLAVAYRTGMKARSLELLKVGRVEAGPPAFFFMHNGDSAVQIDR